MEKFYNTVKDFILKYNIKQVVAEDVNVNNHFTDIRKLCEFRGVLKLICSQLGLPDPKYVNVRTVKKWATGNGNADKKMMIEFCQKRWGIDPVDDNMADATHIFKYYVRIYKL
jgi:Holliday junction resolvasome RuvABC endonuclease subunit